MLHTRDIALEGSSAKVVAELVQPPIRTTQHQQHKKGKIINLLGSPIDCPLVPAREEFGCSLDKHGAHPAVYGPKASAVLNNPGWGGL